MNSVYLLLDRSGSMESQWKEAIGSINGYIEKLPKETSVYISTFDSVSYDVIRNTTVKHYDPITASEVWPRGGTPLFDSAARVMMRILDDKPERAIFVVMTDGEENSSQHFKQHDVKAYTKHLEEKKYEVVFLGANFDKVGDTASTFGLAQNKWTNISTRNLGTYMTGSMATASASYLNAGQAINITAEEKSKAAS